MNQILSIINFILPWLDTLSFLIARIDTNNTGTDDKAAATLADIVKQLRDFVTGNTDPNAGSVAKGLAGITAFGNSVLSALDQLLISTAPKEERVNQAELLVKSLDDSTKVYQAQRGADAEALSQFKIVAAQKLIAISAV